MTQPFDRELTDDEKQVMADCATAHIVRRGHHPDAAKQVLTEYAERGELLVNADAHAACVYLAGKKIVEVERGWLSYTARFGFDPDGTDWRYSGDQQPKDDS